MANRPYPQYPEKECENCGLLFTPTRLFQKYCSIACGRQMHDYAKMKYNPKSEIAKISKKAKQLDKDAAEAKKLGLSYGQYVAYKERGIDWHKM